MKENKLIIEKKSISEFVAKPIVGCKNISKIEYDKEIIANKKFKLTMNNISIK